MESITYTFIHLDWTDNCVLNKIDKSIIRVKYNDEVGTYLINDNELNNKIIIQWRKWEGNDIFIKYNNYYYQKVIYDKYIENYNIIEYNFIHKEWISDCILNHDLQVIFKKNNFKHFGTFTINESLLIIDWINWGKENFIKLDDICYQEKYIKDIIKCNDLHNTLNKYISDNTVLNNNDLDESISISDYTSSSNSTYELHDLNNKYELYKKCGNEFFFQKSLENIENNTIDFHLNNNTNNNYFKHTIIDFEINDDFKEKIKLLSISNPLKNKNYLDKTNIEKYIDLKDDAHIFSIYTSLEIPFNIPKKSGKKRSLSLVEWGYPPFGGGENWLLNFNKILSKNNYENYLICFSDPFKNEYFNECKLIDLEYVKIIQMSKDLITIIKFIKVINPDFINHQGVDRILYMKLSNILEIPFLTGFCFWQNIVKFNMDNINVKMLDNICLEKTDEFEFILNNSYSYASSDFVNDIIHKLYNNKLDVIETISLESDYKITNNNFIDKKYVTLINCHHNKGGYLIKYLCENLNIDISLQFVYTEHDPLMSIEMITQILNERNKLNNINILIPNKVDIKKIYNNTRIILIPSLCDETFCRVGYEAMMNGIPILSTKNGNLKYLLDNYALFINDLDYVSWKNNIEDLYYNEIKCYSFLKKINNNFTDEKISNKIMSKINTITESKYKLLNNNIGIIVPWADQGLGIQSRDYYITLKNLGYNPHIFSFKPYNSTFENPYLQSDSNEWKYENIHYSTNYREDISVEEIFEFVYKYNIKKMIIIEATFLNIFNIAFFLKLIGVKIILVANIECIRLCELDYHKIFDHVLANNKESYTILSHFFEKTSLLGFHLSHPYFNFEEDLRNYKFKYNNNDKKFKFFCTGGLNSLTRKNILLIIQTFYDIYNTGKFLNWELNIYIQGIEIPDIIRNINCPNINFYVKHLSYKEIINIYLINDIFIHLGTHEGLGLGFYESIYCGTPILTIDWCPNNEIIHNEINGWLIDSSYEKIYDNDISIIHKAKIDQTILKNNIINILSDKDKTINIIVNTKIDRFNLKISNQYSFNRIFKNIIDNI